MGSIVLDSSVGVEEDFKDDKLDTLCVVSKVVTSVVCWEVSSVKDPVVFTEVMLKDSVVCCTEVVCCEENSVDCSISFEVEDIDVNVEVISEVVTEDTNDVAKFLLVLLLMHK